MSEANEANEELDGSELGTLSYWDENYSHEISNFKRNGDVGEIWFGEDSMLRVVRWIVNCEHILPEDPVVDVGCGNGMTLVELAREGFTHLLGLDYSESAIKLAISVCANEFPHIQYKHFDILADDISDYNNKFKVVHDKGTYDAISLHPDDPKTKRNVYMTKVRQILRNDGLFVITSCNWTADELVAHFQHCFSVKKILPTPQFRFGGKVGNVVASVIFQ